MTLLQAVNQALRTGLQNRDVLVLGQLVKYGLGGLTTGLAEEFPKQVLTYPVCENFMHASAMGLALAGMRPVVVNERMDFLALAMDPLVNHAAVWRARHPDVRLPMVVIAVVGKGKGQGPQHSKNFTPWLRTMEGLHVVEPGSPQAAGEQLLAAMSGQGPVVYVLHREHFGATGRFIPPSPGRVGLCGASQAHEAEFYQGS